MKERERERERDWQRTNMSSVGLSYKDSQLSYSGAPPSLPPSLP